MDRSTPSNEAIRFRDPESAIGALSPTIAAKIITAATDIALVMDPDGVIQDFAFGNAELAQPGHESWLRRRWADIVTPECKDKVHSLLREAFAPTPQPRWREVNQKGPDGTSHLIRYSAVALGSGDRVLALGRDLRAMSALQQQLVLAQQNMEREYARLRHAEMRYRLLFQNMSEAVLILDAATLKVLEFNPAATELFGKGSRSLSNRLMTDLFDASSHDSLKSLLDTVRAVGRGSDVSARLGTDPDTPYRVSATLFRQNKSTYFLVRLYAPLPEKPKAETGEAAYDLDKLVENLPEGFVVTGRDYKILAANSAFLDMAQLATRHQAIGRSLEDFLGRREIELGVLAANLKDTGSTRNFATVVRGEFGSVEDVDVSAVAVQQAKGSCYGFAIRSMGLASQERSPVDEDGSGLPQSAEQLTALVGRATLKEIVRETTDLIERLCIQAALELTSDNRASAAEMLGLSRQSLYAKLRRYGLGGQPQEG